MSEKRKVKAEDVKAEVKAETGEVKAAKKEKRKAQLTPPPPPPVDLNGVANPLIGNKGLKRALAVAIVQNCRKEDNSIDEAKAGILIRASGICFKSGYKPEAATDLLTQNEWSGRPYANWAANDAEGKAYPAKHPEKVAVCEPFARELVAVTTATVKV